MRYIDSPIVPVVELTRRNLQALLDKLDDPLSARTLIDGERQIMVRAVEDPLEAPHRKGAPTPGAVHHRQLPRPLERGDVGATPPAHHWMVDVHDHR